MQAKMKNDMEGPEKKQKKQVILDCTTQFLGRKEEISVVILKVLDPATYILREIPHLTMSDNVLEFKNMEKEMNNRHSFVDDANLYMPEKNEVVVVKLNNDDKYYRGKVLSVLASSKGPYFTVYLLDYGRTHQVKRNRIFKIEEPYLAIQFQAVNFHLLGLKPLTFHSSVEDLKCSYMPAKTWDESANVFVSKLFDEPNAMTTAKLQVIATDCEGILHGRLSIHSAIEGEVYLNDILVKNKYAYLDLKSLEKLCQIEVTSPETKPDNATDDGDTEIIQRFINSRMRILEDGEIPESVSCSSNSRPGTPQLGVNGLKDSDADEQSTEIEQGSPRALLQSTNVSPQAYVSQNALKMFRKSSCNKLVGKKLEDSNISSTVESDTNSISSKSSVKNDNILNRTTNSGNDLLLANVGNVQKSTISGVEKLTDSSTMPGMGVFMKFRMKSLATSKLRSSEMNNDDSLSSSAKVDDLVKDIHISKETDQSNASTEHVSPKSVFLSAYRKKVAEMKSNKFAEDTTIEASPNLNSPSPSRQIKDRSVTSSTMEVDTSPKQKNPSPPSTFESHFRHLRAVQARISPQQTNETRFSPPESIVNSPSPQKTTEACVSPSTPSRSSPYSNIETDLIRQLSKVQTSPSPQKTIETRLSPPELIVTSPGLRKTTRLSPPESIVTSPSPQKTTETCVRPPRPSAASPSPRSNIETRFRQLRKVLARLSPQQTNETPLSPPSAAGSTSNPTRLIENCPSLQNQNKEANPNTKNEGSSLSNTPIASSQFYMNMCRKKLKQLAAKNSEITPHEDDSITKMVNHSNICSTRDKDFSINSAQNSTVSEDSHFEIQDNLESNQTMSLNTRNESHIEKTKNQSVNNLKGNESPGIVSTKATVPISTQVEIIDSKNIDNNYLNLLDVTSKDSNFCNKAFSESSMSISSCEGMTNLQVNSEGMRERIQDIDSVSNCDGSSDELSPVCQNARNVEPKNSCVEELLQNKSPRFKSPNPKEMSDAEILSVLKLSPELDSSLSLNRSEASDFHFDTDSGDSDYQRNELNFHNYFEHNKRRLNIDKKFNDFVLDLYSPDQSRNDEVEDSQPMETLDFSNRGIFDKQGIAALQLGSKPVLTVLNVEEAGFDRILTQNLRQMKFIGPSCIQTVGWPSFLENKSFVAVAPPHCGKTVSYLLPLLSKLIERTNYEMTPKSNGPFALVLTSNWKKMQFVNQQAQLFLDTYCKVRVLTLCDTSVKNSEMTVDLLNGCDFLIATPQSLVLFLKEQYTHLRRCFHFILDDGNDLITNHSKFLSEIMGHLVNDIRSRESASRFVQIVLCAERWTKGVAAFADRFMTDPLFLFTSFLEVAIFSRLPIEMTVCQKSLKNSSLLKLLDTNKVPKTVITTTDYVSATEVHNLISALPHLFCLLIHESLPHYELKSLEREWNAFKHDSSRIVLTVTDVAFPNVSISDANCLIHYDLPKVSRLQFSYRFACIANSFKSTDKNSATCHILMTDESSGQAVHIAKILRRMQSVVPKELKMLACKDQNSSIFRDKELCYFVKALGSCSLKKCAKRHFIDKDLDAPRIVPKEGDVKALITHVFDATHYIGKILSYVEPETKNNVCRMAEHAKLSFTLQDFYNLQENLTVFTDVKVGESCCVKENENSFFRAKIIEVLKPENVKLMYLDEGWIKSCSSENLFVLPENLKCLPNLAAEIFLCNVKPTDSCPDWNPQANRYVLQVIEGQTVEGKIALCLDNTLFLYPMVIRKYLPSIGDCANLIQLDKTLKSQKYAVVNKQHLEVLYQNCKGKVEIPKKLKNAEETVTANFAFLSMDAIEEVYISAVVNPQKIFVHREKCVDSVDILIDQIAVKIGDRSIPPCLAVKEGMFCLAPFPDDNRYFRAVVKKLIKQENDTKVEIFFLDYGDNVILEANALYTLPTELMLLPFQAIECELAGLTVPETGWSGQAFDALFDLTHDDQHLMLKLTLKAWKKTPVDSNRNVYVVDIYNSGVNLSDSLVERGLSIAAERPWATDGIDLKLAEAPRDSEDSDDSLYSDDSRDSGCNWSRRCNEALCIVITKYLDKGNFPTNEDIAEVHKILEEPSTEKNTPKPTSKEILPAPNMDKVQRAETKAQINWWNTEDEVTVSIDVPGIETFDLQIYSNGFGFRSDLHDRVVTLDETFYDAVDQENTTTQSLGRCVKIVFKKCVAEKWPRLTKDDKKVPYITYDLEHLDIETDSDNEKVEDGKLQLDDEIDPTVPSDDKESEEEILEECDEENEFENAKYGDSLWSRLGTPRDDDIFDMI